MMFNKTAALRFVLFWFWFWMFGLFSLLAADTLAGGFCLLCSASSLFQLFFIFYRDTQVLVYHYLMLNDVECLF